MNKPLRVMIVGALLLLVSAGVAVAQNTINCTGTCEGTDGNDTIVASTGSETVIAKGGDDDVELDAAIAVGGDDVAFGGPGRDCIDGGAGADLMLGEEGDDNRPCEFTAFVNPRAALTSGPGDDRVEGGPGNDSMDGISGSDTLIGNDGDDLIEDFQTADADTMLGGQGSDEINATDGDGDDVVDGGGGEDTCSGDLGDTIMNCEPAERNTAPSDTTVPRANLRGVARRGCVRRAFSIRVVAKDAGGLTIADFRQGTRVTTRRFTDVTDASFGVRIRVAGLRAGPQRVSATVEDKAGNRRTVQRTFRVCAS